MFPVTAIIPSVYGLFDKFKNIEDAIKRGDSKVYFLFELIDSLRKKVMLKRLLRTTIDTELHLS